MANFRNVKDLSSVSKVLVILLNFVYEIYKMTAHRY